MAHIGAFRALRYDAAHDPALVTAPPYDAIDEALAQQLHARSPVNVVRLELGTPTAAPDLLAAWQRDGVLVSDGAPTVTIYEQRFEEGGVTRAQVGVLAALATTAFERGEVLPHERIYEPVVAGRMRLLDATRVNISPVFVLAREPLDLDVTAPPDLEFRDPDDGVHHRAWVVHDRQPPLVGRLLMADGHHRYTSAVRWHAAHRSEQGAGAVLAYVVGGDGPVIRPQHRVLLDLPVDAMQRLVDAGAGVEPSAPHPGDEPVLVTSDGAWRVTVADSLDQPAVLARLAVTHMHAIVTDVFAVPPERQRSVTSIDRALAAVEHGEVAAAVLVAPPTVADVWAVAQAGVLMPPKSTWFAPKPRTGIALRPLH